jgi:hypothetical protein
MPEPRAGFSRPALSPDAQRAQRLLVGGAIGGHAGALVCTAAFFVLKGPTSGVSCLLACAVTLAFYVIGQAVQIRMADADVSKVLTASLLSYGVRVSALGGLLAVALSQQDRLALMDATAVVAGTLTVVVTWLAAEIVTFSRLRFPVFDDPASKPGTHAAS